MLLGGVALLAAGAWWLWGSRWVGAGPARFREAASEPTRMVIGLVHLVLGYHLIVWTLPESQRPPHMPQQAWHWVVGASVLMMAGSVGIDQLDRRTSASRDKPDEG